MVNWTNIVDSIYCIHYTPNVERYDFLCSELDRVGILNAPNFHWYKTDGNNDLSKYKIRHTLQIQSLGKKIAQAAISHLECIKEAYERGDKNVLILENDICFLRDEKIFEEYMGCLPKDYDIIQFDYLFTFKSRHQGDYARIVSNIPENFKYINISRLHYPSSAAFYMLSRKGMKFVIDYFAEGLEAPDAPIYFNANNLKKYISRIRLGIQKTYNTSLRFQRDQRDMTRERYCTEGVKIKDYNFGTLPELKLPLPPSKNKFAVYTCITGGYDDLIEPKVVPDNMDFICFTDDETLTSEHWKIYPIPSELDELSQVKQQRFMKILAHKWLSNYDESLWIDGNMEVIDDINKFIKKFDLSSQTIAIARHPQRDCIYDEVNAVLRARKDTKKITDPIVKRYEEEGFPRHFGLVETGIIYRKHNDPTCKKIMEAWAEELKNGSHRDQLSFNYVLWKLKEKIYNFPPREYKRDIFKIRSGHKRRRVTVKKYVNQSDVYKKGMMSSPAVRRAILRRPLDRALQSRRIRFRGL